MKFLIDHFGDVWAIVAGLIGALMYLGVMNYRVGELEKKVNGHLQESGERYEHLAERIDKIFELLTKR